MDERRTIPSIRSDAKKLAKEFIQLEDAADSRRAVIKLLHRLELMSMASILDRLPGDNVTEKARLLGVSRQTYYYWLQGRSRPSFETAMRLSALTGIPLKRIKTGSPV